MAFGLDINSSAKQCDLTAFLPTQKQTNLDYLFTIISINLRFNLT